MSGFAALLVLRCFQVSIFLDGGACDVIAARRVHCAKTKIGRLVDETALVWTDSALQAVQRRVLELSNANCCVRLRR